MKEIKTKTRQYGDKVIIDVVFKNNKNKKIYIYDNGQIIVKDAQPRLRNFFRCGKPSYGYLCRECTKKKGISLSKSISQRKKHREIRKERKENGLCIKCGKLLDDGKSMCKVCLKKQREYNKKHQKIKWKKEMKKFEQQYHY